MHHEELNGWQHDHLFGQDQQRPAERRTQLVILITAVMMVVEVAAGITFGSMALLADGLHMASHACALSISAFAYVYTRRHAANREFSFGTGKVNALGGFTGAVLLAVFAILMCWESVGRLLAPVTIAFDQAILVAVIGLVVNGMCALILGHDHDHDHDGHSHGGHDHGAHDHESHGHHQAHDEHVHEHGAHCEHGHAPPQRTGEDHNLRSAYLHVLADALTSLLAIFALLGGKYFRLDWMDPLMGIVGALLISRWSIGLLRSTAAVLLDKQAPRDVLERARRALEQDGDARVTDLHVWSIAPGKYSAIASLVADEPQAPEHYKSRLPQELQLVHQTIEVHECTRRHS